jgi:hypothetical protein
MEHGGGKLSEALFTVDCRLSTLRFQQELRFWCRFRAMSRRYFSVAEVERLIPTLERIFVHILQLRAALRVQEQALERAGVRLTPDLLDDDDPRDGFEVRQAKGLFRGYYEALSDELSRIKDLGGEVKDIDTGLVDFPGRRGGEEILLCWRLGEQHLGFWHTPEAGYAGRRPIDDQVPREPTRLD